MTRRGVVGALVGALVAMATGCGEECIDSGDCREKKGDPGQGRPWACIDNTCSARDVTSPPERDGGTDAGMETDGGMQADGGM